MSIGSPEAIARSRNVQDPTYGGRFKNAPDHSYFDRLTAANGGGNMPFGNQGYGGGYNTGVAGGAGNMPFGGGFGGMRPQVRQQMGPPPGPQYDGSGINPRGMYSQGPLQNSEGSGGLSGRGTPGNPIPMSDYTPQDDANAGGAPVTYSAQNAGTSTDMGNMQQSPMPNVPYGNRIGGSGVGPSPQMMQRGMPFGSQRPPIFGTMNGSNQGGFGRMMGGLGGMFGGGQQMQQVAQQMQQRMQPQQMQPQRGVGPSPAIFKGNGSMSYRPNQQQQMQQRGPQEMRPMSGPRYQSSGTGGPSPLGARF